MCAGAPKFAQELFFWTIIWGSVHPTEETILLLNNIDMYNYTVVCKLISFLAKLNFLKDSFTTTLYLLNFIGFWPTFGLFHYAKLPSYKRVRWGRLAGPSQNSRPLQIHPIANLQLVIDITFETIMQFWNSFFFIFY